MRSRTLTSLLTAIFLVLLVAATLATRETKASGPLYVSTDGLCGGYAPCYTNVQDALLAAFPFDEILVATGTYTVPAGTVATINKTVTLLGGWDSNFTTRDPQANPTTLDAQGLDLPVNLFDPPRTLFDRLRPFVRQRTEHDIGGHSPPSFSLRTSTPRPV